MKEKLVLPIYLNQKFVFDLLAIIENGFSQMETIKTGKSLNNTDSSSSKGEIGLNNAFAFLKFGVSVDSKNDKSNLDHTENLKEKIHTPSSLFSKMREYLLENKLIIQNDYMNAKPGEFIELKLSLTKSPIIDAFETLLSLMKMASVFEDEPQSGKRGHKNQDNGNKKIVTQIEALLEQLKAEGSIDLIGSYNKDEFKVVSTIDRDYLGDPSLADIADGEFSVLGKITRVITKDSDEEVNLLRKTTLSKLNSSLIEQMFSGFSNMEDSGIKKIEITTELKGPVIQIIPIAIFV